IEYKSPGVWVLCHGGNLPLNAVAGDDGKESEISYVGRALQSGDVIPGRVVPSSKCCYVGHSYKEFEHKDYQVLVTEPSTLVWLPSSNGAVPSGAIQGGAGYKGEPLYIARAPVNGKKTIGKVHPSLNAAFIPYGGTEHRFTEYEVLVCKTNNF
ncbi:hypothetical protein V5799_007559, partial [Amblyomma americanum]